MFWDAATGSRVAAEFEVGRSPGLFSAAKFVCTLDNKTTKAIFETKFLISF
jgi:hypothetical protein